MKSKRAEVISQPTCVDNIFIENLKFDNRSGQFIPRTMNFTLMERGMMKLIMKHKNDDLIAEEMGMEVSTVRSYKKRILHKIQNMEISLEQNIAFWEMCD